MKWHAKNTGTEWKCFIGMHAELVKAAKAHREAQSLMPVEKTSLKQAREDNLSDPVSDAGRTPTVKRRG
jgi:hypothetical protein